MRGSATATGGVDDDPVVELRPVEEARMCGWEEVGGLGAMGARGR